MRSTGVKPDALRVLVLPAFVGNGDDPCELRRWLDGYDFSGSLSIPGSPHPLRYTSDGIGVLPTGMGKSEAATTLATLASAPPVDLSDTYFLSVGIAGISPLMGTLGSVFLADTIVDWDHKYRLDPTEPTSTGVLPYRQGDPLYRLNAGLVSVVTQAASEVPLVNDPALDTIRGDYEYPAAQSTPHVGVGTTVSSDEYWHGSMLADRVQWFLDEYDAGRLCTTQMEEYGTATALARFGHLDRYLSIRAGVNFDRPPQGRSAGDNFDTIEGTVELTVGLENAFRVGSAIVDYLGEADPA